MKINAKRYFQMAVGKSGLRKLVTREGHVQASNSNSNSNQEEEDVSTTVVIVS